MKKHLLHLFIGSFLVMLFGFQQTMAQEKTSTITITITEDDKVTTDTTFELAEGQDPEMIKKMVTHMAGGDMHKVHVSKNVHMSHSGDHKMVWVSKDGDHSKWHAESMMEDINLDSIKEAHGGGKVMVMKNADGEITVKELDGDCEGKEKKIEVIIVGDEDMEWVEKDDGDESVDVYIIKTENGEEVKVVKKKVRVEIEDEDESEKEAEVTDKKKKKK